MPSQITSLDQGDNNLRVSTEGNDDVVSSLSTKNHEALTDLTIIVDEQKDHNKGIINVIFTWILVLHISVDVKGTLTMTTT
uniref:Uncharacterized protein n=1 Tax=Fagus sylvatica TaxID=28930 RepID=A0A2N9GHD6_FAGSY